MGSGKRFLKYVVRLTHFLHKSLYWCSSLTNMLFVSDTSSTPQVGDPLLVLKKTLCMPAVPNIADLRKLLKSCHALFQLAEALSQDALQQTVESIISFLCAWFDFEGQGHGILLPGNEELDSVKAQYIELPNLLRRVYSSICCLFMCCSACGMCF